MAGSHGTVGILALQGDFAAHQRTFQRLKVPTRMVRRSEDMHDLRALVLPGGESTTLIHLLNTKKMWYPLQEILRKGLPFFATCAGLILVCSEVLNHPQKTLNVVPVTIERNAYGRQRESFESTIQVPVLGSSALPTLFIRAPRILSHESSLQVLASYEGSPVLLQNRHCLLATFHSELTHDLRLPRYFLEKIAMPNAG